MISTETCTEVAASREVLPGRHSRLDLLRTPDKTCPCSRIRENSERFLNSHEFSFGFVTGSKIHDWAFNLYSNLR